MVVENTVEGNAYKPVGVTPWVNRQIGEAFHLY